LGQGALRTGNRSPQVTWFLRSVSSREKERTVAQIEKSTKINAVIDLI
jgi:hypothetical protein